MSPGPPASKATTRALWISVAITLALYVVPYGHRIGYPLVLLSTLVHELGHGVAGLLVGGRFESFRIFADGSGVAMTLGVTSRFGRAFVSAGGLCGPALVAGVAFAALRARRGPRIVFAVFGAALITAEVLVVRNAFGLIFVGILALLAVLLALRGGGEAARTALALVAVQLALSVFSRGDYLFMKEAHTARGVLPSDVQQMAQALVLPYWVWGLLCAAFSLAVLALGLRFATRVGATPTPVSHAR